MLAVNDRVELTAARGGWDGYIARVLNGPEGQPMYEVASPARGDRDEGRQHVLPVDINQQLTAATFSVGDNVSIAGHPGTIQADNGDGTFDVEVEEVLNRHLTVTRTHVTPLWRLAVENTT